MIQERQYYIDIFQTGVEEMKRLTAIALANGGDYCDLYFENTVMQIHQLIDTAKKLEGMPRHASTHAAGVLITDKPVTEYVPLQKALFRPIWKLLRRPHQPLPSPRGAGP